MVATAAASLVQVPLVSEMTMYSLETCLGWSLTVYMRQFIHNQCFFPCQVQSRASIRPARRTVLATQASADVPRRQALSAAAGAALLLVSGMSLRSAEAVLAICAPTRKEVPDGPILYKDVHSLEE